MALLLFFSLFGISHPNLWCPSSEKGTLTSLYIDWFRCLDEISINGQSLRQLVKAVELTPQDSPSQKDIIEFTNRIILPHLLKKLPKESSPETEVAAYRELIDKYKLQDIFQKSYAEFKAVILTRDDLNTSERLMLLDKEESRQLTLLDTLFPKKEENNTIRQHFRALNQIRRHLFQAAIFDQPGTTLQARGEMLALHPEIRERTYTIKTSANALTLETSAAIKTLMKIDSGEKLTPPANSQAFVTLKGCYQITVSEDNASMQAKSHTLEINSEHAKGFKKMSSLEKVNQQIFSYMKRLREQIQQDDIPIVFYHDPLLPIVTAPLSADEKLLKQKKICVLSAAQELIRAEMSFEVFCEVLMKNPGWNQGATSRSLKLVKDALQVRGISEEQLHSTLLIARLNHAIERVVTEMQQQPPLSEEKLMQRAHLKVVLKTAKDYYLDKTDDDSLQSVLSCQSMWKTDKNAPGVQLIEKILAEKPPNSPTPS